MFALSLALAALAAACNASSSVLQRKANLSDADQRPLSMRTAGHVLRRPAWLLGLLAMVVSFVLQAIALGIGQLAAVEPVLAVELPLTLLLAARVFGHRLQPRDWLGIVGMTVGLAVLIAALDPSQGSSAAVSSMTWLLATSATAVPIAVLWLVALRATGGARSALFGIAAGAGFGLTAAMIKAAVDVLTSAGVAAVATTWQLYGVVVCGLVSVWLVQNALHSGALVAAQPGITLLDPIVSVIWGVLVYAETVNTGPAVAVAVAAGALIAASSFVLARARALESTAGRKAEHNPAGSSRTPRRAPARATRR
ncbi:MAG TPA: DMT family transporter [Jatrophihabitans sp.]|nr:DMT family transporter [Jatrophihabitans sp.]